MNEDRYVYVRIQASTFETILSLTPTSKNRIERSIWNSGARVLFISILFRVRPSFHLIPSVHFIFFEFYRIASRLLFLSLFLSFVHAVLYPFSVSGRSIFCTPIFFFSRTLFVLSSFSIRLISPTFPATPHFLRNRFTFFSPLFLSLSLSPSSCPYNSFVRGLFFHAPSSLLPIRFILPARVFPFWLSGSLPRSLVALVYHSWLSYREIQWYAFTLCARDVKSVSFH